MDSSNLTRRDALTTGGIGALAVALVPEGASAAPSPGSREEANIRVVHGWCDSWGATDFAPESIVPTYFAADARARIADSAPWATGHVEIAAAFKPYMSHGERIRVKYLHVMAQGPVVVTQRTDTEIVPGKPDRDWPIIGIFVVRDGRICEWTDYVVA